MRKVATHKPSFDTAAARIAKEPGLRDVDRSVFALLLERGAWREPLHMPRYTLANELHYAPRTVGDALRRLADHQLIRYRRDGRRGSVYQTLA